MSSSQRVHWGIFRPVWVWLVLGVLIRLLLAPFTYARDYWVFVRAAELGVLNPQSLLSLENWTYPPPHLWVLAFMFGLWLLLPGPHTVLISGAVPPMDVWYISPPQHDFLIDAALVFFLKLPSIVADVLIGFVLFTGLQRINIGAARAELAFKLWMLNPVSIWISSATGHFDSIPALFTLYSLVSFLEGKTLRSAISLGLGGAWKLWPFVLIPLFLLFQRGGQSLPMWSLLRRNLRFIVLAVVPLIFFTSIALLGVGATTLRVYTPPVQGIGYSVFLGYVIPVQPLSYWLGGIPLTLSAVVLFFLFAFQLKFAATLDSANSLITALLLLFLALSPISAQYMMWLLPFLTIQLVLHPETKWFYWILLLIMVGEMILAMDQLGFGFYYAAIIPQTAYDTLNSLLVNGPLVGTLRGVFVGLSFWYVLGRLAPAFRAIANGRLPSHTN